MLSVAQIIVYLLSAATFSIPEVESITEIDGKIEVCITLSTAPLNAELAAPVNLTVSTLGLTGMILSKIVYLCFMR